VKVVDAFDLSVESVSCCVTRQSSSKLGSLLILCSIQSYLIFQVGALLSTISQVFLQLNLMVLKLTDGGLLLAQEHLVLHQFLVLLK
jgi:hypothetical protein